MASRIPLLLLGAALIAQPSCKSPGRELERVAKDWCLTIRASQVLPVYPLTEDLQPGDVFAVQTPLKKQAEIYEERGFLPLDQHVVRLPAGHSAESAGGVTDPKTPGAVLPYQSFYRDAFWLAAWRAAVARPGWPANADGPVLAPRAAFPSYTFSVQEGTGLKLAIPISGVPVGLGLMGASRAAGSVTIRDAYTYGIDIESLYAALLAWWGSNADIRDALSDVAQRSDSELYLRAVNRVYLTSGVTVSLQNLDSLGAGVDAGIAPELELLDLAVSDPLRAAAAADAYRATLASLSGLAPGADAVPGGGFRFTQASQRAVTMDEDFDRPLVLGYLGFDVRVEENGSLSPPIPSFALLNDRAAIPELDTTPAQRSFELHWTALETGADAMRLDAVLSDAARRVGGEFQATFAAAVAERGARLAFLSAKNTYIGVESSYEAEDRLAEINSALEAALMQEEEGDAE
jgi:hypothetical protein